MWPTIVLFLFFPCRNFCAENVLIFVCEIKLLFTLLYFKSNRRYFRLFLYKRALVAKLKNLTVYPYNRAAEYPWVSIVPPPSLASQYKIVLKIAFCQRPLVKC